MRTGITEGQQILWKVCFQLWTQTYIHCEPRFEKLSNSKMKCLPFKFLFIPCINRCYTKVFLNFIIFFNIVASLSKMCHETRVILQSNRSSYIFFFTSYCPDQRHTEAPLGNSLTSGMRGVADWRSWGWIWQGRNYGRWRRQNTHPTGICHLLDLYVIKEIQVYVYLLLEKKFELKFILYTEANFRQSKDPSEENKFLSCSFQVGRRFLKQDIQSTHHKD